jgi:toxin YoeB
VEIVYTESALSDLAYWKKSGNIKIQLRIAQLLQSISDDPFNGIGKPEPLKHQFSGTWSRRINKEHRLIYKVEKDIVTIFTLRYHYQ